MYRQLFVSLAVMGALLLVATPTMAASPPIDRYNLSFFEESTMPLEDLEECVGYTGTIWEQRNYDVQVTEFVDGPRQGRIHLTGEVLGEFSITPDEEDGPTYTGGYREKITFIGTSFDDPLIAAFSLPASAVGSDGSSLRFLMHGHIVVSQDQELRLIAFKSVCIQ